MTYEFTRIIAEDELRFLPRQIKQSLPTTRLRDQTPVNHLNNILDSLIATASAPDLSSTHRVAAWNALSASIEQCNLLDDQTVSESVLWGNEVWKRTFQIYLNFAPLVRPKSLRQLLIALTSPLRASRTISDSARVVLNVSIKQAIPVFETNDDSAKIKALASALAYWLTKTVLTLDDVVASIGSYSVSKSFEDALSDLIFILCRLVPGGECGSAVGHLIGVVLNQAALADSHCSNAEADAISHAQPIWSEPLLRVVRSTDVDYTSLRAHLLPALFTRGIREYRIFLETIGLTALLRPISKLGKVQTLRSHGPEMQLLCSSLRSGKALGLLELHGGQKVEESDGKLLLPVYATEILLSEASQLSRLTGLSLLIQSSSATARFQSQTFQILKRYLPQCLADTDANFRSETFSLMQILMDRSRAVTAFLARSAMNMTVHEHKERDTQPDVLSHRNFVKWLLSFLCWQLRPTCSYQRHISALKLLWIVLRSGVDAKISAQLLSKSARNDSRWPFTIQIMNTNMRRYLIDLILDPFDDVRHLAKDILVLAGDVYCILEYTSALKSALARGEMSMLASGRADQADGVSLLYSLLNTLESSSNDVAKSLVTRLEHMLDTADIDLEQAVAKYPLHGLLTSLNYVLEHYTDRDILENDFAEKLILCLQRVWHVVKPTLCDDAPEGYLPESLEEAVGVTTKETLSYCWRALKEASLLLGSLMKSLSKTSSNDQRHARQRLFDLCFVQLSELRHRGAFSTVAQTWAFCCTDAIENDPDNGEALLESMFEKVLLMLRNKTIINTRRSAGLPSLVCGILAAAKSGETMQKTVTELERLAREPITAHEEQESSLSQVHAMNCLKDVMKHSKLGERSEQYLPSVFKLAAHALRSRAWAIRNCGLMLFRAGIDRLLGTSDAHLEDDSFHQKQLSYDGRSEIFEVVQDLVINPSADTQEESSFIEGVFPALQLLQRLRLPGNIRSAMQVSVQDLTGSRAWHLRDKAAGTYASLIPITEAGIEIRRLLDPDNGALLTQNQWHGRLLCAKYIISRVIAEHGNSSNGESSFQNASSVTKNILAQVCAVSHIYTNDNFCVFVHGAYIDVLRACLSLIEAVHAGVQTRVANGVVTDPAISQLYSQACKLHLLDELRASLDAPANAFHVGGVTRMALSRALAVEISLFPNVSVQSDNPLDAVLFDLSTRDGDAAVEFFETLTGQPSQNTKRTVIESVCQRLLTENGDNFVSIRVRLQARRYLIGSLIDGRNNQNSSVSAEHIHEDQWLPENREAADCMAYLALLAMNAKLERHGSSREPFAQLADFFRTKLIPAVAEDKAGLDFSRYAVAEALGELPLTNVWQALASLTATQSLRRDVAFVIYDLLNDDDEDIRLLASSATSRLLLREPHTPRLAPLQAGKHLLPFFLPVQSPQEIHSDEDNRALSTAVLQRAFGDTSRSIAQQLATLLHPNTALFAEEKQNLYIDDAREVHIWSRLALKQSTDLIPSQTLKSLAAWTTKGLEALRLQAETERDGPLGWTTDADVFTLGLRVIYAAELLLMAVAKGRRLHVRPSLVRKHLGELYIMGAKADFNHIWMHELERVWKGAVLGNLRAIVANCKDVGQPMSRVGR